MSSTDSGRIGRVLASTELRAVAGGVAVLGVSATAPLTALLAPAAWLLTLSAALVARPSLQSRRAFNVALAAGVVGYGSVYAVTVAGATGLAVGALLVGLGLLMAGNHLGVVPWSDHARQV